MENNGMALDRGQRDGHFGFMLYSRIASSTRLALVFLTFLIIFVTINYFDTKPVLGSEIISDEMPNLSDPDLDINR